MIFQPLAKHALSNRKGKKAFLEENEDKMI